MNILKRDDAFKLLELTKNASEDDIKRAYKKLAFNYHPDKHSSPDAKIKFINISEAYNEITKNFTLHNENKQDSPQNRSESMFSAMFTEMMFGNTRMSGKSGQKGGRDDEKSGHSSELYFFMEMMMNNDVHDENNVVEDDIYDDDDDEEYEVDDDDEADFESSTLHHGSTSSPSLDPSHDNSVKPSFSGGWFQKGFFTQKTHSNPVKAQQSDREHDESRVTVSEDQNTSKSKKKRRPKKKKSKRKKYGDESATATDDSCNSRHDIDTNDASAPSSSSTATNRYDSNDLPKDCVQTDDSSPNSEAKFRNTSTSIDIDIDIVKSVHKADAISSKSVAKSSDRKHDKSNNTSKAKTAASKSSKKSDAKPSDSSEAKSSKKVYLSDSVTDSDDDDDRIESKNNAILLGIAERNKLFRSQAIKTSENIQTVEYSNDFALDEDITYRGVVSQKDDVAIDLLTEDIVNFRCFASESTSCTDNDATSLSSSIQSTKFSDFGREYETKYESQDSVEVLSTHDEEITVLVGQSSKSAAVTTTRNAAVSKPGSGPNKSTKSNNATAQNTSKTDLGLSKQQSQNKRNKSSKQSVQQAYVPGLHPKPVSQTVDKVDATVNTSSNTVSFVDSQVKLSKADNQLGANREDIRGLRDGGGSAESSRGNTDRSNVTSRGHGSDTGHELLSYCSYSSVSQSKVADFDLNHAYLRTDSSFPAATLLQASSPSSAHIDKLTEDMNLLNFQMTNDYGNTNTANALGHLSDTPIHSSILGNPAGKSNLGPIGPPRSSKVIRAPVLPSYPLNIHDRVLFANRVTGTVVFVGQVHFEKGVHVGILPDEFSHGYNNGIVDGIQYFEIPRGRLALIVPILSVKLIS